VPEADARLEKRPLERERASEQEGHQIVAPVGRHIDDLVGQGAILVDPIAGDVRAEVRTGGNPDWLRRAHVRDFHQWAGPGIALAEQQEVVGVIPWQNGQIRLDVARAQARGDASDYALPDVLSDFAWGSSIDGHEASV